MIKVGFATANLILMDLGWNTIRWHKILGAEGEATDLGGLKDRSDRAAPTHRHPSVGESSASVKIRHIAKTYAR